MIPSPTTPTRFAMPVFSSPQLGRGRYTAAPAAFKGDVTISSEWANLRMANRKS